MAGISLFIGELMVDDYFYFYLTYSIISGISFFVSIKIWIVDKNKDNRLNINMK
jgi:hypothetical protein